MTTDIRENILDFQDYVRRDANHRFRSWEHCYSHFRMHGSFTSDEHIDLASLHLSFYLASWGMYRGSTFLLWKDYKIHDCVVRELLKERYSQLWDLDVGSLCEESPQIGTIFDLSKSLRDVYKANVKEVNGERKEISPSDTLLTKILLGTIGCTPAYDAFFVAGAGYVGLDCRQFRKNSFLTLLEFYRQYQREFDGLQAEVSQASVRYPIMKLIDMYFWNIGRRVNRKEQPERTLDWKNVSARPASSRKHAHDRHVLRDPVKRWSSDKPVKQVVWEAVLEFIDGDRRRVFEPKDITAVVLRRYPRFNKSTIRCQIISDCVNHRSRHHYAGGADRYWLLRRGKFRLYDQTKDLGGEAVASR